MGRERDGERVETRRAPVGPDDESRNTVAVTGGRDKRPKSEKAR